jgi:hypothetical protein
MQNNKRAMKDLMLTRADPGARTTYLYISWTFSIFWSTNIYQAATSYRAYRRLDARLMKDDY